MSLLLDHSLAPGMRLGTVLWISYLTRTGDKAYLVASGRRHEQVGQYQMVCCVQRYGTPKATSTGDQHDRFLGGSNGLGPPYSVLQQLDGMQVSDIPCL